MNITDLPDDVLYSIFPYLTASEFLRFTSSTRTLLPFRGDSTFWRTLTCRTFRVPPQPLLQGTRWLWLYKKLSTQTRLYTWGDNTNRNLGRRTTFLDAAGLRRGRRSSGWPGQPELDELEVGIVADVQCGGWSTTLLNSIGNIFIFGVLDGETRDSSRILKPRQLNFPPAYPPTTKNRYEPSTAIKQFSTGRSTVLGLSDDGKVWSWTTDTAAMIKPLHVDMREHEAKTVVAGWDRGSMYVKDVGIVYWAPVQDSAFLDGGRQEKLAVADALLIDTVTVPGTGFRRESSDRFSQNSLEARIGEVTNHIVLEAHIVFITHLNKVFSYPTTYPMPALDSSEPVELTTFGELPSTEQPFHILDLQGAFRNFAIFTASNQILTANREFLDTFSNIQTSQQPNSEASLPLPTLFQQPPQHPRTISLAFGDHHIHALHEDGTITSWGQQSQGCGALGLGERGCAEVRGVNASRWGDHQLSQSRAKTVWFEPMMERWLTDVYSVAKETGLSEEAAEGSILKAFGDYYEKEGAKWEADLPSEEGELGAYFVLKVAAAGWSSAALVLVDDEKAERARQAHIVSSPCPPSDSENDSEAEYEYGDSPFDMVEIALSSISNWLWGIGRRFLGLTERDARREALATAQGVDSGESGKRERYTWNENPVPIGEILTMALRERSEERVGE